MHDRKYIQRGPGGPAGKGARCALYLPGLWPQREERALKGNVVGGVGYLVDGAKMLGHPALRLFVIVPLAINIIIFAEYLIPDSYVTQERS